MDHDLHRQLAAEVVGVLQAQALGPVVNLQRSVEEAETARQVADLV